jgi:hypothetical protein
VKVYNRSKIKIIRQHAIASCGDETDGVRFERWFFEQGGESFLCEGEFSVIVMTKERFLIGETLDDLKELRKMWQPGRKLGLGMANAVAAAEILMKEANYNAHKAAYAAAGYNTHCGMPIYSITKTQLRNISPDFAGWWIGDYQTPINKMNNFLISHKQWLKT